jgi:hypothetical protein
MLPIGVAAQGKNERERQPMGQKIRLLSHSAEQIQRHHASGRDQPRQQAMRLFDGG